jgi:hypothetical protein
MMNFLFGVSVGILIHTWWPHITKAYRDMKDEY